MTLQGGLDGMLRFLKQLEEKGVKYYRIDHVQFDALMVSFALVGIRVEVSFYSDRCDFCIFKGNEDVETDQDLLLRLFEEYWE